MNDEPEREIDSLLKSIVAMDDDVTHFVVYEKGYYALLRTGRRLDITRIHAFQPGIDDFDDYFGYLFIESIDGFFIMRQRILENRAQMWVAVAELVPFETGDFFRHMCWRIERLHEVVAGII